MKIGVIFLLSMMVGKGVFGQDNDIQIGLASPAYGVNIKAKFGGSGGWARGYRISNHDGSENFIQLGTYGGHKDGVSTQNYSYIGLDHDRPFLTFLPNGNLGVGIKTPVDKLAVNGNIRAREIKVEATNWPDYVFKKDYELMPLKEVEQHIQQHGHLPDVPKAMQIEEEGLSLGEMNKLMMKKIEELTLHLIEKDKQLDEQEQSLEKVTRYMTEKDKKVRCLEDKLEQLQNSINDLKNNSR